MVRRVAFRRVAFGVAFIVVGCSSSDATGPANAPSALSPSTVLDSPTTPTVVAASDEADASEASDASAGSTAPSSSAGAASTTSTSSPGSYEPSTLPAAIESMVFSLRSAAALEGWRSQNDPVMGGVSTGEIEWQDEALVFAGELSLDNGGGFASIVSPSLGRSPARWSTADGVELDVIGDGQTYVLQLRLSGGSETWIQRFDTTPGTATTVALPWSAFEPVGRFLDPIESTVALDRSAIDAIAIYILDGQEGPFRLALQSVA